MTTLIAPGHNRTPRTVKRSATSDETGMVYLALAVDSVSPMVRWYSVTELATVNDKWEIILAAKAVTDNVIAIEPTPVQGCELPPKATALAIWKPVIELPIDMLGYYKEGSGQKAIPGLVLHMTNSLVVLRPPSEWAA